MVTASWWTSSAATRPAFTWTNGKTAGGRRPTAAGLEVLNAFAYTGAFGVYAARAGARSVVNVDTSAEALALAAENLALNGCAAAGDGHRRRVPGAAPLSPRGTDL